MQNQQHKENSKKLRQNLQIYKKSILSQKKQQKFEILNIHLQVVNFPNQLITIGYFKILILTAWSLC